MGLFGLFATLFGLGSFAKNTFEDTIYNLDSEERAYNNNSPYYHKWKGNKLKKISTATGKECEQIMVDGHWVLCDSKTHMPIQDLTQSSNDQKTEEYKREAKKNESRFYRTAKFDTVERKPSVYANDDMPGKYFECVWKRGEIGKNYRGDLFTEIELEYDQSYGRRGYRFKFDPKLRCIMYLPNGEVFTPEKEFELVEQQSKEKAIREGKIFYEFYTDTSFHKMAKKVGDDSGVYYYNRENRYFTPGILKSYEEKVSPHRTTETRTVYYSEPDPDRSDERYWADGTEWIR